MAFNGRWVLQETEGDIKAYLAATGFQGDNVEQKVKDAILTTGPDGFVVEYDVTGDQATRRIFFKGELKRENTGKFGEERDGSLIDGRPTKFTIEQQGNRLIRKDNCGGVVGESVFEVNGDSATTTMSCGGVTVVRKFTRA